MKPKVSRREEIKIREKINEIENKNRVKLTNTWLDSLRKRETQ